MRKQLLDAVDRMRGRSASERPGTMRTLDRIPLTHRNEAQQHRRRLAAVVAAEESPFSATDGDVLIRPLGGTIIDPDRKRLVNRLVALTRQAG